MALTSDIMLRILNTMNPRKRTRLAIFASGSRLSEILMSPYCVHRRKVEYDITFNRLRSALFVDRRNVFLTGPAGSGKSYTIHKLVRHATRMKKNVQCLAPTQYASELIPEGQTIHSFIGCRRTVSPADFDEWAETHARTKRDLIRSMNIDVLVIDECSMVGAKLLHGLNRTLQLAYSNSRVFGGCQVVFCGDFYQLPPVGDSYAFKSDVWAQLDMYPVHLSSSFRHRSDRSWFTHLTQIRDGHITTYGDALDGIRRISEPAFATLMQTSDEVMRPLFLSANNAMVERMNRDQFDRIDEPVDYRAFAQDIFYERTRVNNRNEYTPLPNNYVEANNLRDAALATWRAPALLEFKRGARYIITQNINKSAGIINGMRATYMGNGELRLDNGKIIPLSRTQSDFIFPVQGRASMYLMRSQMALRLGYAITIHKSQGMTLSSIVGDVSGIFQHGQLYVLLSRVRRREDLTILDTTGVTKNTRIRRSKMVDTFYRNIN